MLRTPDQMTIRSVGNSRAYVVAFDGIMARTQSTRVRALVDALREERMDFSEAWIRDALCGRNTSEAARVCVAASLHGSRVGSAATPIDETLVDLVALRAARDITDRMMHEVTLEPDAIAWIATQTSAGARIAVRADSSRSDVTRLFEMAGLDHQIGVLACGDDSRSRASGLPADVAERSCARSWSQIDVRLRSFGLERGERAAVEPCAHAADVAREYARVVVGEMASIVYIP